MRETNTRFIIYDIDLPITLNRIDKMFEENSFEDISLDIIVAYSISVNDSPRNNHNRIYEFNKIFQDFKQIVKNKNDKGLLVEYEKIPCIDSRF